MKRVICAFLVFTVLFSMTGCGSRGADTSASVSGNPWQEQYDLGVKYLEDGNYEEAVLAFTAAIEIDPKQPVAYLKLADAYIGLGDTESAQKTLQDGLSVCGNNADLQAGLGELDMSAEPSGGAEPSAAIDPSATMYVSGNEWTFSINDPNLQKSYDVNLPQSEDNIMEYGWLIAFTDGVYDYEVGTTYWKPAESAPATLTPEEMQSDLWVETENGHFLSSAPAQLHISGTTLSWTFTIPEEYASDHANMRITETTIESVS